jgi:ribonuclease P protein subunit POP4
MALTPETLTRHELVGLHVQVVDAPNPDLVGIRGRVVRETMRTLFVERSAATDDAAVVDGDRDAADDGEPRVWQVPKRGATLEFAIPSQPADEPARTDEAAGDREAPGTASERPADTAGRRGVAGQSRGREDVAYVTVDGDRLLSRPALRTEHAGAGDTTWR